MQPSTAQMHTYPVAAQFAERRVWICRAAIVAIVVAALGSNDNGGKTLALKSAEGLLAMCGACSPKVGSSQTQPASNLPHVDVKHNKLVVGTHTHRALVGYRYH